MINLNYNKIKNLSTHNKIRLNTNPINSCISKKHNSFEDIFVKSDSIRKNQENCLTKTKDIVEKLNKRLKETFGNKTDLQVNFPKYSAFDEVAASLDDSFTEFDTPAIVKAREELANAPLTHLIDTPERELLRKEISSKLYGQGAYTKLRQVYVVMGPPTSGKSTALCEPLAEKTGSMIIDPDMAKEFIPEYEGGKFAAAVHEESWMITHGVIDKAINSGDNVVLPLVGSYSNEVLEICNKFEKAKYKIHLRLLDVDPEVAAKRAVIRYDRTGRFVDPYYVLYEVGKLPRENFYKLLNVRNFNTYASFSNDVPKGQPPILIDKSPDLPDPFD